MEPADDTIGSADEFGDYEYEPDPPRTPLLTTEVLAVTSLALSVCAFFATGLFQFLSFVVDDGYTPVRQYIVLVIPTAFFAALGVVSGIVATRRPDVDRWTRGIAGAGACVGAVELVLAVVGIVIAVTMGDAQAQDIVY
jgi:hypothetical protein